MTELTIINTTIRQDSEGRYCLNDLHKASGGKTHHRPSKWLATKQAKGLIEALGMDENKARIRALFSGTQKSGTYIVKELVYAYAMWISPEFHLRVIRAYDALVTGEFVRPTIQQENYWFQRRPHWPTIRERVLLGMRYKAIAADLGITYCRVTLAVRRMIEVGLLSPLKVAAAQVGPARRSARMQALEWGMLRQPRKQLSLFPVNGRA